MIVLGSRCHLQEATTATGNPQPHSSWPRLRTHSDNWMAHDLAQARPQWRRMTHGNRTRPSASSLEEAPPEFFIDEMPLDEEHDPDDEAAPAEAINNVNGAAAPVVVGNMPVNANANNVEPRFRPPCMAERRQWMWCMLK